MGKVRLYSVTITVLDVLYNFFSFISSQETGEVDTIINNLYLRNINPKEV